MLMPFKSPFDFRADIKHTIKIYTSFTTMADRIKFKIKLRKKSGSPYSALK